VTLVALEPEVAKKKGLDELWFTLETIADTAGLTESELLEELKSGRMIAHGERDGRGGFKNIAIRGDHFIDWLARTGRKLGERPCRS
jgi:hypothetical protein